MNGVSAWILGILGIVVIGVVIDLVLPSERMSKYIRSVFATVTMLVILLPLPSLVKNGCNTGNFSFGENMQLQDGYLEYTASIKRNALLSGLRASLQRDGITLGDTEIEGDFSGNAPVITAVKINLRQVVITTEYEHIHKYALVQDKVAAALSVEKDVICLYEQ